MTSNSNLSRRQCVRLFGGAAGATALAGCAGEDDGDATGDDTTGDDGTGNGELGALEIQHWWTAGGDAVAMEWLVDGFLEEYPEAEVEENPVAGGGGVNLQAVIRERVLAGDPPSTWQDWPGRNLNDYVEADAMRDITYIWEDETDFAENFREGPKLAARAGDPDNPYVAVPMNIHRINNLFYDVETVEEAGIDLNIDGPRELIEVLEQVESETDAAGVSWQMSAAWSTLQVFGVVLKGMYGHEVYNSFQQGDADEVRSEVEEALEVTGELIDFNVGDAPSIDNDEAGAKLPQGEAAFAQEGDWLAGNYLDLDDYDFEDDWDHIPFPGTDGIYQINTDGFPFPQPNPTPETTEMWMKWVGSREAQRGFNPLKGAIPCRDDVEVGEFPPFLQRQFDDFSNAEADTLTIAHGDGVTPNQDVALKDAMSRFMEQRDAEVTAEALITAMVQHDPDTGE